MHNDVVYAMETMFFILIVATTTTMITLIPFPPTTTAFLSLGVMDMLKQCDIATSMLCRYTVPLWHGQELCTVLKGDPPGPNNSLPAESRNLTLQWRHYHALVKVMHECIDT